MFESVDEKIRDGGGRNIKRKKKRSANQMAKKFARKAKHGQKGELEADTYQYVVHSLELMQTGFPTDEERLIFANNFSQEAAGHEVDYARNEVGSKVLEMLLDIGTLEIINRLVDALWGSLRPVCCDRYASHVVQKIIYVCADRGNKNEEAPVEGVKKEQSEDNTLKDSERESYDKVALKLSRYVINNMEEFMWDTYANHVLRTVVEALGGFTKKRHQNKKTVMPSFESKLNMKKEYTELLVDFCKRIYKWPQFPQLGQDELTSGLLQVVLLSLKGVDSTLGDTIIKRITESCFTDNEGEQLSSAFQSECYVRLLEACLMAAGPDIYNFIYEKFFAGHLYQLLKSEGTAFSVQQLLDNCEIKEKLEGINEELFDHYESVLKDGPHKILVNTANACKRLHTGQGAFFKALTKALHCEEEGKSEANSEIIECIASLKGKEMIEKLKQDKNENIPVQVYGSLILQAMLNFNKPIKIVNGLLAMPVEKFMHLITDPRGSHIIDAFMTGPYIGVKSREKLARKLRGNWSQLAVTTHGSRCLEKIWSWAQGEQKVIIMEELAASGEALRSTKCGSIISSKFNVPLFVRSKKDWMESFEKKETIQTLFADILGEPKKK
ncbi:nucleolar protein 9 [Orussus abietinus]|uniref:nucleolar protein 9 n=1 Tax=Orussus abietinus TaxID=222816 RepID=UPI000626BB86|nr:nucleolar protein 9 [Orussus abietinus]